jgi:hypothetical protein
MVTLHVSPDMLQYQLRSRIVVIPEPVLCYLLPVSYYQPILEGYLLRTIWML